MQPWKSGLGLISEIWGDKVFKREGQFHGIVDMALKFQIHHITNKLVYKFYPYVEIQETKRIKAIGQIFFRHTATNVEEIFQ